MPFVQYGAGGHTPLTVWTFWYGLYPIGDDGTGPADYVPMVAYHPSLKRHTMDQEVSQMLKRFGRRSGIGGFNLPDYTPPHTRFSPLKLWGRWTNLGLHLSVCKVRPDPRSMGLEVISGYVNSERGFFLDFAQKCKKFNGLTLTLLDDDANPRPDQLNLLVERFQFTIDAGQEYVQ